MRVCQRAARASALFLSYSYNYTRPVPESLGLSTGARTARTHRELHTARARRRLAHASRLRFGTWAGPYTPPRKFRATTFTQTFFKIYEPGWGAAICGPVGPCGGSTGAWRDNAPVCVGCGVPAGP